MKRNVLLIACGLILMLGCNSKHYFIVGNPPGTPHPYDDYPYIDLKKNYTLYIRVVYIDKNQQQYFITDNLNNDPTTVARPIGEVEYLLLSNTDKKVIYITTIRDKYKNYYSKHWLGDGNLNAYDFNKFYPGTWNPDKKEMRFTTTDGEQRVYWTTDFMSDSSLLSIDTRKMYAIGANQAETLTDSAAMTDLLKNPIIFRKVNSDYQIVFKNKYQNNTPALKYGKIYFKNSPAAKDDYNIYLRFNDTLAGADHKDSTIMFKSDRLEFSPTGLLEKPKH